MKWMWTALAWISSLSPLSLPLSCKVLAKGFESSQVVRHEWTYRQNSLCESFLAEKSPVESEAFSEVDDVGRERERERENLSSLLSGKRIWSGRSRLLALLWLLSSDVSRQNNV